MPSFRRRASVIDADKVDDTPSRPAPSGEAERVRALAEEAEAEAQEAEAAAAAARARARALRLRREAEEAGAAADGPAEPATTATEPDTGPDSDRDAEPEVTDDAEADTEIAESGDLSAEVAVADDEADDPDRLVGETNRRRRRALPRPTWRGIVATLGVIAIAALLTLSGYMIWEHREAERLRQLDAEYSAAARQSVVTLMSLNFNNAEADVQRIIDNATGEFRDDFEAQAQDFVQVAKDSKVITEVSVNATGVESMTDDTAVVLVAASSRVTNSGGANQEPRTWRLSVSLQREGDQLKMSKVEFVP